jgi:hypothetical protein
MNIVRTTDRTEHNHSRTFQLEGMDPQAVDTGSSHKGKKYIPREVWAKWEHGQPIKAIVVRGSVLKMDGTVGMQEVRLEYRTPASTPTAYYRQAPEWVLALFDDAPHTKPENV